MPPHVTSFARGPRCVISCATSGNRRSGLRATQQQCRYRNAVPQRPKIPILYCHLYVDGDGWIIGKAEGAVGAPAMAMCHQMLPLRIGERAEAAPALS